MLINLKYNSAVKYNSIQSILNNISKYSLLTFIIFVKNVNYIGQWENIISRLNGLDSFKRETDLITINNYLELTQFYI